MRKSGSLASLSIGLDRRGTQAETQQPSAWSGGGGSIVQQVRMPTPRGRPETVIEDMSDQGTPGTGLSEKQRGKLPMSDSSDEPAEPPADEPNGGPGAEEGTRFEFQLGEGEVAPRSDEQPPPQHEPQEPPSEHMSPTGQEAERDRPSASGSPLESLPPLQPRPQPLQPLQPLQQPAQSLQPAQQPQQPQQSGPPQSVLPERLTVLYDFAAEDPSELSAAAGETVEAHPDQVGMGAGPGWCAVRNAKGRAGLIPTSFLQLVTEVALQSQLEELRRQLAEAQSAAATPRGGGAAAAMARSLHDFEAEEDNELSVRAGQLLTIISREGDHGEGWCLARRVDGSTGLIPLAFLEEGESVDAAAAAASAALVQPAAPPVAVAPLTAKGSSHRFRIGVSELSRPGGGAKQSAAADAAAAEMSPRAQQAPAATGGGLRRLWTPRGKADAPAAAALAAATIAAAAPSTAAAAAPAAAAAAWLRRQEGGAGGGAPAAAPAAASAAAMPLGASAANVLRRSSSFGRSLVRKVSFDRKKRERSSSNLSSGAVVAAAAPAAAQG